MVRMVEGDLFDPSWGFDAIGHGVNCKGLMGAGIAVAFKKRWPDMYERYRSMCEQKFLLPGQVMPYAVPRGTWDDGSRQQFWIYNIASQYHPGANAEYSYLYAGLQYVAFHMHEKGIVRLGLPWIGAGIGGLDKDSVLYVVSQVFDNSDLDVTIVSLPE